MNPLLLPGTHVLRRDARTVQVGLTPGRAVVLPADEPVDSPRHAQRLVSAGLAWPDDAEVRAALPPDSEQQRWTRHSVAALARDVDPLAGDREPLATLMERRRDLSLEIVGLGHPVCDDLVDDLTTLCERVGLRVAAPRPGRRRAGPPPRRLTVLLCVGEPHRSALDPLVREGIPHLLVRWTEGRAVVGPLVEVGQGACGRCLDAHLAEENPAWHLLVEQQARATGSDRADGIPEPLDPALAAVVLARTVREITAYADGAAPVSASATLTYDGALELNEHRRWPPHPSCGCGWS